LAPTTAARSEQSSVEHRTTPAEAGREATVDSTIEDCDAKESASIAHTNWERVLDHDLTEEVSIRTPMTGNSAMRVCHTIIFLQQAGRSLIAPMSTPVTLL